MRFREGPGGLSFIDIANDSASASICLQGAHLTHWQPRSQSTPVIFLSAAAQFALGRAIRGGIPICWPWFGAHETNRLLPSHGFARVALWEADEPVQRNDGTTEVLMRLTDSAQSRALWPHPFRLEYRIVVGERLNLDLTTTNTGTEAFSITEALHTYFNIADLQTAQVLGLDGARYADSADGGQRRTQTGAVQFAGEVDRVFVGTEAACTLVDSSLQRRIHITKSGSRSTVVWNPGHDKAARMVDLGGETVDTGGWRQMVCVESANALENRLALAPGGSHRLHVSYRVES